MEGHLLVDGRGLDKFCSGKPCLHIGTIISGLPATPNAATDPIYTLKIADHASPEAVCITSGVDDIPGIRKQLHSRHSCRRCGNDYDRSSALVSWGSHDM